MNTDNNALSLELAKRLSEVVNEAKGEVSEEEWRETKKKQFRCRSSSATSSRSVDLSGTLP